MIAFSSFLQPKCCTQVAQLFTVIEPADCFIVGDVSISMSTDLRVELLCGFLSRDQPL